jgi:hypothetical protein
MKSSRQRQSLAAALVVLVAASCGGPDAKQKALRTSLLALNAARDGFVAWDKTHQDKIVADAESYDQGKAALEVYRTKREPVVHGFSAAYSALAAAALDPSLEMVVEAAVAAKSVYDLIKSLTGGKVETPDVVVPDAGVPAEPKPADGGP